MYLKMKRNAIEKIKGKVIGMEFTPEEIVLLTSNLEEDAKHYDEKMQDKLDAFRYSESFKRLAEDRFKNLFGIEKISFDSRKGVYVIEKLVKQYHEAFQELADRQAKVEEEILNKEYTLEQLFIEELKMRKLKIFNFDDLLQNCRLINAKYNICVTKKGKYILKEKQ